MKVSFFDKRILHKFYGVLGAISVITSIVFLFVEIDTKYKTAIGLTALGLIVVLYFGIWLHSNVRRSICLKINASEIEVKFGDIFSEQADLKAIAFNEYFDTQGDSLAGVDPVYLIPEIQQAVDVIIYFEICPVIGVEMSKRRKKIFVHCAYRPELILCLLADRTICIFLDNHLGQMGIS